MNLRDWLVNIDGSDTPDLNQLSPAEAAEEVLSITSDLSGHRVPDRLLRRVGSALVAIADRDNDVAVHTGRTFVNLVPDLTRLQIYRLANRVAWPVRGYSSTLTAQEGGESAYLYDVFLRLESKRFMFDDKSMLEILDEVDEDLKNSDPAVLTLMQFCIIRRSTSFADCQRIVSRALDRPQVRAYQEVCFDIIAHALWLNAFLPDQGRALLDACDKWRSAGVSPSPILDFRTATAYRLLGDFAKGIEFAERALSELKGSVEFVRTFSEQCIRERELSVAGLASQRQYDLERKRYAEVESSVSEIERKAATRTIEVVTLFTAAAAFALGGVSAVGGQITQDGGSNPRAIVLLLSGFGGVLVLFALASSMLIEITANDMIRKKKLILVFSLVVILFVIQFGTSWLLGTLLT